MICWYCQKRDNGSESDADKPCSMCDRVMEHHVILISYSEEHTKDERYPFRTGGWVAVREAFIRERCRHFPQPEIERIIEQRCMVVDDEWWKLWRLPRSLVN